MDGSEDLVRQVRLLTQSRDKWKKRSATKHGQILYLRVRVRDLQASRDAWKQRARAAESSGPATVFEPADPTSVLGVPSEPACVPCEHGDGDQLADPTSVLGEPATLPGDHVPGE